VGPTFMVGQALFSIGATIKRGQALLALIQG
jgi:hypothetical protein